MSNGLPNRYLVVIDTADPVELDELRELIDPHNELDEDLRIVGMRELEKRATNKLAAAVGRMARFVDAFDRLLDDG